MHQFKVKGKEYPLTKEMKIQLQKNKVSMALLCRRIELGWSLYESVNVPVGLKIKEFRENEQNRKVTCVEHNKKLHILVLEEKQKREKKPWLYDGTPQVHPRSQYVQDMMVNDIYPKNVSNYESD
ncbi:SA1788 family PVL leukocidin-associated protein [Staphylococcus saprophyticus]|nr:SA1788 family PVL leukocidin-associated protein [Staphylococcus saprophyticus]